MSPRRSWICAVSLSGFVFGGFAGAQTPDQAAPGVGVAQATPAQPSSASAAQAGPAQAGPAQQLRNRSGYFNKRVRTELENWLSRNKVTPYQAASGQLAGSAIAPGANAKADAVVTDAPAAVLPRPKSAPAASAGLDVVAAPNAVVVPPAAIARYGYSAAAANTAPDTWFYDYYNYVPTYYYAAPNGAAAYAGASRYVDFNQDGVYDAVTVVRNPTSSGSFATYDRIDFVPPGDDRTVIGPADTIRSARRRTATGTIDRIKIVRVNGGENLVVRVNTSVNNPGTLVDMGSVGRWPAGTVKDGDVLSASGPQEDIGDRSLIIAETVKLNTDPEVQIRRISSAVEGQVVDVIQADFLNSQHTLAVLDTGSSRQVIDLGPTDQLKFKVEPGVKIVAEGVPVQFQKYVVVLADHVAIGGQDIVIERWQ